ncbi:radical SAM protein [bacterium]|nr:MAG: radical SAM protein [bacterium]
MKVMFVINDLGINEPFGPMILSAIVKEKGHETLLGVIQKEDVMKKIASWKPDMLAYSMMSVDMEDMRQFNRSLREKTKIFTLLGGPHATLDRTCINDPDIDAICVGEGDGAIIDVIEYLENGRENHIEEIPNIMTSESSPMDLRPFLEDLDNLPFMDRALVYDYPFMGRFGIKGVWATRGCMFRCPYCFNNRYNQLYKGKGKIVRRRSVDSMIRETKELIDHYRVDFIRIQDDAFILKVDDWIKEFAERWPSEIGIPFYCLLRSECVTDEMAYYLKKAGCFSICMSIETADDAIRNRMLRRPSSQEELEEAFHILKKHNIHIYANTMLALPFTSLEHDIASVDFAIKSKPDMPNFSIFMPYPGTDLGDYCQRKGIYDPQKDPINYGMRNMSPLTCFSRKEIEAQYNICELAIVAVKLPFLRNVIVNHLIYWKPNKIFFFIHYLFAIHTYGKKIFYFKHTFKEYIDLFIRTFRHYMYDFFGKERNSEQLPKKKDLYRPKKMGDIYTRTEELEKCMEAMTTHYQADLERGE